SAPPASQERSTRFSATGLRILSWPSVPYSSSVLRRAVEASGPKKLPARAARRRPLPRERRRRAREHCTEELGGRWPVLTRRISDLSGFAAAASDWEYSQKTRISGTAFDTTARATYCCGVSGSHDRPTTTHPPPRTAQPGATTVDQA